MNFAVSANRHAGVYVRRKRGREQRLVGEPRWHRSHAGGLEPGIRRGASARLPSRRTAKSLAVTVLRGASQDIWVKQLPTGPFSRLTFGDTVHFRPAWTADGRSLVYMNDLGSGRRPADDDAGRRHRRAAACCCTRRFQFAQAFATGDGRWLVLRRSFAEAGDGDIYAVKTGDTTLVPLLTTPAREMSPAVSPDGRWLAYVSDESGAERGLRAAVPGRGVGRWQVSVSGGTLPVWARSGRELFYLNGARGDDEPRDQAGARLRGRAIRGCSSRPVRT